jgi:hypothetical protein
VNRFFVAAMVQAIGAGCASIAIAQVPLPASSDDANFGLLFGRGRALMAEQQYAQACAIFDQARALRPTTGILLNLADCYEKLGRSATAWHTFQAAAETAHRTGDRRERYASDRAAALEPRLATLTIDTSRLTASSAAELRLDGTPLEPSEWRKAIAVDPGEHAVGWFEPGKRPWIRLVEVAQSTTVVVTSPEDEGTRPAADGASSPLAPAAPSRPDDALALRRAGLGAQRIAALALGGAGAAGLLAGGVLGLVAKSTYDRALQSECGSAAGFADRYQCNFSGVSEVGSARTQATVATVGLIGGATLVGGAAILYLATPGGGRVTVAPSMGVASAGLGLYGQW